jgi:hypothetical protein
MLTIENVGKAYYMDVAGYRIGKVESTPTAYRFHLANSRGDTVMVSLSRTGIIEESGEPGYNIRCSYNTGHFYPLKFSRKHLVTSDAFLSALRMLIV